MTLEELIGARLVVGFHGTEPTDALLAQLRALHIQSLIVFERNVASPGQFTRLIRRLEEGLGRRLLLMVDHEGGRVIRFRSGVTPFPDACTVGRSQEPSAVERQGATEADELKRLGLSVNLAPCVDVLVEGSDPVIGVRSYGSDPARVAALSVARIRGLQSRGVAACAKHFPGLGAVPRDPHKLLPTITLGWDAMERVHLAPFRAAIEAGVATVMSSHVCYPGLGEPDGLPATFSPRLLRGVLRERMGFQGLTLTDDLEMGALRAFGSMGDMAVRATEAGHDLLLICSDLSKANDVSLMLRNSYQQDRLNKSELEASAERLFGLKQKYCPEP